jgi:hypothetical protein
MGVRKNERRKIIEKLRPCFSPRFANSAHGMLQRRTRMPAAIQKETSMSVDAKFIPALPQHFSKCAILALVIYNEVWQVHGLLGRIESDKWAKQLTFWAIVSRGIARR